MPFGLGRNKSMSTDPQMRQFEKRIADEARVDQKNLNHAMRDMKGAEKTHLGAMKVSFWSFSLSTFILTRRVGCRQSAA